VIEAKFTVHKEVHEPPSKLVAPPVSKRKGGPVTPYTPPAEKPGVKELDEEEAGETAPVSQAKPAAVRPLKLKPWEMTYKDFMQKVKGKYGLPEGDEELAAAVLGSEMGRHVKIYGKDGVRIVSGGDKYIRDMQALEEARGATRKAAPGGGQHIPGSEGVKEAPEAPPAPIKTNLHGHGPEIIKIVKEEKDSDQNLDGYSRHLMTVFKLCPKLRETFDRILSDPETHHKGSDAIKKMTGVAYQRNTLFSRDAEFGKSYGNLVAGIAGLDEMLFEDKLVQFLGNSAAIGENELRKYVKSVDGRRAEYLAAVKTKDLQKIKKALFNLKITVSNPGAR
jgi:hypothetical protein